LTEFTPLASSLGGVLIGLSAALLLGKRGRIAGISGIAGGLFVGGPDRGWRGMFVLGLIVGGVLTAAVAPEAFGVATRTIPLWVVVLGGLLVGVGTRLGRGCTSGHGVCGISRGSPTSIAATVVFVAFAMLTVFVVRHVIGLGT
jgi:uncharacterized membrane protein YedE/YeeE